MQARDSVHGRGERARRVVDGIDKTRCVRLVPDPLVERLARVIPGAFARRLDDRIRSSSASER
jgi:hypothetical protein